MSNQCQDNWCTGGKNCCERLQGDQFYCKPQSQCVIPNWEIIFIPVFLFVVGLILSLIVCFKLCKKDKNKLKIRHYAHQEFRVKPQEQQIVTYTTVLETNRHSRSKEYMM